MNAPSSREAATTRKISPHLLAVLMLGDVSQIGQVLLLRELLFEALSEETQTYTRLAHGVWQKLDNRGLK